jgi:hypothetical protein
MRAEIISHLGRNPVNGGRPAKDRRSSASPISRNLDVINTLRSCEERVTISL